MNYIILAIIIGVLILVLAGISTRGKSLLKKYTEMGRRDLLLANLSSKRFIKIGLIVVFIGPLPLGYITSLVPDKSLREMIFALFIILVSTSFAMCIVHWKISDLTEAELKLRQEK